MKPIPSPKGLPFVGTIFSLISAGGAPKLHLYVDRRHKELGPIYREKIGPVSAVFVADGNYMRKIFGAEGKYPKHIVPESWLLYNKMYGCERGLLFMDGEEWLKFRKIMNNIMLKARQDEFFAAVDIVANNLIADWHEGEILHLEERLYQWSLEVVVAILLGSEKYENNKTHLAYIINNLAKTVHKIFIESATMSLIPIKIAVNFKLPVWKRFVQAATSAVEEGNKMVDKILQIEKETPREKNVISEMQNTGMELNYLKRIVTDLILAAGDTTAYTMQWLLHLLSMNPNSQELIYDELKKTPEKEAHQCNLLKGCLKEALRLYPVAPFLTRNLPEDLILDGYRIKAQELLLMSLYSSGRNNEYFPDSECFLPERWLRIGKGYKGVINPNASLPFAMGSRSCIGKKIAETQILVTISKIMNRFIIKSGNEKIVNMTLRLISVPAEPVKLILESREK